MVFKFVLKTLLIALGVGWIILALMKAEISPFGASLSPETLELESVASGELLEKKEMLE